MDEISGSGQILDSTTLNSGTGNSGTTAPEGLSSSQDLKGQDSYSPREYSPGTFADEMNPSYGTTEVTIKSLLEAGAHYGHQAARWNPGMLPFIFGKRKDTHIINLDKTLECWEVARKFLLDLSSRGGIVLFVGTKQQARSIVERQAKRSLSGYVTRRWLGGTLTNFSTIRNSLDRMRKLEELHAQSENPASGVRLNKKERLTLSRELERLEANIGGIRNMRRLPDALFVIDVNKEHIAIEEAKRLGITIIALVDTNVNPALVDYPIPANDDSTRALELFASAIGDVIIEGSQSYEQIRRLTPSEEYVPEHEVRNSRERGRDRGRGRNDRGGDRGGNSGNDRGGNDRRRSSGGYYAGGNRGGRDRRDQGSSSQNFSGQNFSENQEASRSQATNQVNEEASANTGFTEAGVSE
jgi:small subunit ribosomal protein S2